MLRPLSRHVLWVGLVGLAAACGSTIDTQGLLGSGGAGSGGSPGDTTTTQHTTGTPASTGSHDATASVGQGGNSAQGGSSAQGAGSGTSMQAGTGGAAPACPPTEPMTMDACTDAGQSCSYAGDQCTCDGGFGQQVWVCSMCPTTPPSGQCQGNFSQCNYGSTQCICAQGDWQCGMCPTTEPTDGDACMGGALACNYGSDRCSCFNGDWHCFGGGTGPGGVGGGMHFPVGGAGGGMAFPAGGMGGGNFGGMCPTNEPMMGDPCNLPAQERCMYNGMDCVCANHAFICH